jgi:hypothetical protein
MSGVAAAATATVSAIGVGMVVATLVAAIGPTASAHAGALLDPVHGFGFAAENRQRGWQKPAPFQFRSILIDIRAKSELMNCAARTQVFVALADSAFDNFNRIIHAITEMHTKRRRPSRAVHAFCAGRARPSNTNLFHGSFGVCLTGFHIARLRGEWHQNRQRHCP